MTIARPRTQGPRHRPPSPRGGAGGSGGLKSAFMGTAPTSWYDSIGLTATDQQTMQNLVGSGSARRGSGAGSDANDPTVVLASPPYLDFDGTDDYLQLQAGDAATFTKSVGKFTVLVCYLATSNPAGTWELWDDRTGGTSGSFLFLTGPGGSLAANVRGTGTASASAGNGLGDSTVRVGGLVVDDGVLAVYTDHLGLSATASTTGLATDPGHNTPRVGSAAYTVANNLLGRVYAVVTYTRALNITELNAAAAYLLASHR